MPKSVTDNTGDGVITDYISISVLLPESGNTVIFRGQVQPVGKARVPLTGSPITSPTAGGATIFWMMQADVNGLVTVKQDAAAIPAPDAGNILVFSDILLPVDSDLAQSAGVDEPTSTFGHL